MPVITGGQVLPGTISRGQADEVTVYTVATLPTAGTAGRIAFASNALKVGETTGLGTGTLVYDDGTAWRRVGDDVTVAA